MFSTEMATRSQSILSSEQSGIPTAMNRVSAGIVRDHIMKVKLGTVVSWRFSLLTRLVPNQHNRLKRQRESSADS